jgi:hypothetical protein
MFILFSISALCFFALVAATIAIARRARSDRTATPPQSDFAQHLFAAAEAQNSRVLDSVRHQAINDILAKRAGLSHPRESTLGPIHTHTI